jgi:hypothetical protein
VKRKVRPSSRREICALGARRDNEPQWQDCANTCHCARRAGRSDRLWSDACVAREINMFWNSDLQPQGLDETAGKRIIASVIELH